MNNEQPAVLARGLRRTFGEFVAVDGIDFEIERGECFGFLGPNGAGKTTTMRMIYRASPVDAGRLEVLGLDAASGDFDRQIKAQMGVVAQEDNLDTETTVRENLLVFCRFYGLSRTEAARRADELLAFAGLVEKADQRVQALSGGMKRRLMIARGLISRPRIVILDEPSTGLDPRARQNVWDGLARLREDNVTLVLTTHYMDEAERLCDRIAIMDRGRIVACDSPAGLIARCSAPQVIELSLRRGPLPDRAQPLLDRALRVEHLRDRVLLYVDTPEALVGDLTRELPDHPAMVRRASLEDVFLELTGRGLED
ncbi:ABC transporter ATP-binding protein [Bradymonadaceae bacterium TMQ3]|uniref:ABC transporter ATP-binding protein n=2 Tax=Lujinxingia sediminis TaxID=2480984 RepID=A0ABY0CPL4_9DELT|nr:ABC transporter ATP-binding protein [Bradymonadaceae bacterium TMQ3]RVU41621.1 ABC transporter ATP-binding protein [Lujinxingia sediminis]TXC69526.1 ABC transporter ATP-binding protein [Bradymonadales bacterium TMQ1]